MKTLTAADLLSVWERGAGRLPVDRAMVILAAVFPDQPLDSLADLSIGQRDAALLSMRLRTFGPRVDCLAECPMCSERVEINFQIGDLMRSSANARADQALVAELEGYQLHYRLPNSRDLLAALAYERQAARRMVVERCVLAVTQAGQPVSPAGLPESLVEGLGRQMAAADPLAEISFDLSCPSCQHGWLSRFDILAHLWSEIETWAYRTLEEIHRLARSYGWSEADILGLSAWRRRYYLSLI